jgi:hypothetical protein
MGLTEEKFQLSCCAMDKNVTRVYEGIGPSNRIVTPYKKNELVALAYVRHKKYAQNEYAAPKNEIIAPGAAYEKNYGWNVRQLEVYNFKTKDECLTALAELKDLREGFVCINNNTGQRVKLKNLTYLAAHRLRGNGLNTKSICELVLMNETEEYLASFPEDAHRFVPAEEALATILCWIGMDYEQHEDIESQKEFALAIQNCPNKFVLFKMRKSRLGVLDAWLSFPLNKRVDTVVEYLYNSIRA